MTTSFSDLGVPTDIARSLERDGIDAPFPIQALTLPDALAGRDVCGRAPTGSGKTLAFAIPLAALTEQARPNRPRALVLVPTRELAAQVRDTVEPLAKSYGRSVATFYGGTNIKRDQNRLSRGVDIAVATPGRIADLVQRRDCILDDVTLVVLDEADRMADMGFLPEVKRLLDRTSSDRQTLLFSATLDGDVDVLVKRYQHDPARHEVDNDHEEQGDTRHVWWPTEHQDRKALTADILRRVEPAIVFTRTKHGADRLAKQLAKKGIRTAAIHGNRSQNQREKALAQFADGSVTTLVATDVAARGIHVDDVGLVVHFDMPATEKDYVHRSGRTGRAGNDGLVVSLVLPDQHKDAAKMQRDLDLPQGLHPLDLDLLTNGEVTAAVASSAKQGETRTGSSNGNSNGNDGGGNNSSGRSRNGHRKGQSRQGGPDRRGSTSEQQQPRGGARNRRRRAS